MNVDIVRPDAAVQALPEEDTPRRLGPFGSCEEPSREQREKGIAAMVRAGHSFDLSRTIVNLEPGCHFDIEMLEKKA